MRITRKKNQNGVSKRSKQFANRLPMTFLNGFANEDGKRKTTFRLNGELDDLMENYEANFRQEVSTDC